MAQTDSERSVEMSLTECESEMIAAFRDIRDAEVAQLISELVHVLSISHIADVLPMTPRPAVDLKIAGGLDTFGARKHLDSVPIDLDLVDA